ncbi:unnamed protein product [Rhodiola kirilowii]
MKDVSNKKKSAINKTAQKNTHSDDDYSLDPQFPILHQVLELNKRNEDDAMAMANVSTLFYIVATHFGQTQKLRSWLLESCIW